MRSRIPFRGATLVALAFALSACTDGGATAPTVDASAFAAKKGGGGGGGGGGGIAVSMAGDLSGAEQTVSGRNDAQTISVNGDYTLTLDLDFATLECGDLPGSIPDESGLLAYVQSQTPRVGALSISYDKTTPETGQVDNWTTTIGSYNYRVQIFRWASNDYTDGADGTVVSYRGGSIEVFKMKRGRYISREQCFGNFVDYDLTVR
jgi:hypothetical protein